MKAKVSQSVLDIVDSINKWSGIRAIVLQYFAEKDIYDPNFSITMDVYNDGEIPDSQERLGVFSGAQFFETSHLDDKDRFLLNEMPIRLSYKKCEQVDAIIAALKGDKWLSIEKGTYLFYRIATGTVEWFRDGWINEVREKIDNLPDTFWSLWVETCRHRVDHLLGNMAASALKNDALYFQLSLGDYLRSVARMLFAINHVFEPGPRDYTASLDLLEIRPEGFEARWASLLREDTELPPERKREVADILARSLFVLKS